MRRRIASGFIIHDFSRIQFILSFSGYILELRECCGDFAAGFLAIFKH
jgi:hypothetical protein